MNAIADSEVRISEARSASRDWAHTPIQERVDRLRALRFAIVDRRDEVVAAVAEDANKTRAEALMTDLLPTLEIMMRNEELAPQVLGGESRRGSMIFPHSEAWVTHEPFGAVLVIGPYNNPFQLTLLPTATALAAGNAVIIKPSERSPKTAAILANLLKGAGLGPPLTAIVEGGPDVARSLVEAGPDLIFFTGGVKGGKAVMKAAAEIPVPVLLELGGKDPMIVFPDADIGRAARAAVWGAFAHDGQHCISVERAYVHQQVHDAFVDAVQVITSQLERGRELADAVDARVEERCLAQVKDAVDAGAALLTPETNGKPAFPAVLTGVTNKMSVMREETFGPILPIASFKDEDDAIALANDCPFALNASIWTGDPVVGSRVASRVDAGAVVVNGVLTNAGHPMLPFGGNGRSGFGRYHGPEGLRAFSRTKAIVERPGKGADDINWFPYGEQVEELTDSLIALRYGRREGLFSRMRGWLALRGKRNERLKALAQWSSQGKRPRKES